MVTPPLISGAPLYDVLDHTNHTYIFSKDMILSMCHRHHMIIMIFLFFTSPLAPLEAEICPIEVLYDTVQDGG